MEWAIWIGGVLLGLLVLVKSSDVFISSAEKVGKGLGLSPFIIGITIVAIGTSLPELLSSIFAVLHDAPEIVAGNVIGSNVANILLVLGVAAIMSGGMDLAKKLEEVDLPLFMASSFFLIITAWDGMFSLFEGLIAIILGGVYLHYAYSHNHDRNDEFKKELSSEIRARTNNKKGKSSPTRVQWITYVLFIASMVGLYIGAQLTVTSVVNLSGIFQIGTEIIALTLVAVGTSLPELVVSLQAVRRGNAEVAVGNIFGSNIFNALFVMGIPSLIQPLPIPATLLGFGLLVLVAATMLFHFMLQDRRITRWEGMALVLFYFLFLAYSVGIA